MSDPNPPPPSTPTNPRNRVESGLPNVDGVPASPIAIRVFDSVRRVLFNIIGSPRFAPPTWNPAHPNLQVPDQASLEGSHGPGLGDDDDHNQGPLFGDDDHSPGPIAPLPLQAPNNILTPYIGDFAIDNIRPGLLTVHFHDFVPSDVAVSTAHLTQAIQLELNARVADAAGAEGRRQARRIRARQNKGQRLQKEVALVALEANNFRNMIIDLQKRNQ